MGAYQSFGIAIACKMKCAQTYHVESIAQIYSCTHKKKRKTEWTTFTVSTSVILLQYLLLMIINGTPCIVYVFKNVSLVQFIHLSDTMSTAGYIHKLKSRS